MADRSYESLIMEEIDLSDKVITIEERKAFTRVTTTYERFHRNVNDRIVFTNRIICPNCNKKMFGETRRIIPHEEIIDIDMFESMNRIRLLSDSPFICTCGAKIKLEFDALDNNIFAYIDNTNDFMEFLRRVANNE